MGFALNILRWFWSQLSVKSIAIVLVLAVVAYGGYRGYHAILNQGIAQGVAQQAKVTAQWQAKAEKAEAQSTKDKAELKTYKDSYNQYVADTIQQQSALAAKQRLIVADLNQQIDQIQRQLAKTQEMNNDISNYISAANDVACVIPTGLLLLYNRSLQDSAPAGGFLAPSPGYAHAASGVSCSTFAGYLIDNNATAVQSRSLLIQWQRWYTANASALADYVKANHAALPPAPEALP